MNLFDLHCDTPFEMYKRGQDLFSGNLHISLDRAAAHYDRYIQIMDIWSDRRLSDNDCYIQFLNIYKDFTAKVNANSNVAFVKSTEYLSTKASIFLGVEDARLLDGDISRLDILYDLGVRFLTLLWGGETCIGGSHNTNVPLTEFGKKVVSRCFEIGIIPDISHASDASAFEMLEIADTYKRSVIATHSNSKAVCNHSRNLSDELFVSLISSGGIVGISLCPDHLNNEPKSASLLDVLRHVEHYFSLGGENSVAFGCDFDGTELPQDTHGIEDVIRLANEMSRLGYSDEQINNLFYNNAYNFVVKNLR